MAAPNDSLNQSGNTERQMQSQEQGIRATAFGGINLSANPLNIPYEDSPLMRNVVTDLSGSIVKRKGTRVLYREADQEYRALTMMPMSTPLAYNLLCLKNGLDLEIYEVRNNQANKVLTKFNIWTAAAQNVRASWVLTSELSPRLICATGVNKPVQFTFTEAQTTYNPSPVVDRVVYTDARLQAASAGNTIVWVNRQRYTGAAPTFIWTGSELRVQFPSFVVNPGDVVDITMITWQWWAEAFHWLGDRFFATQTRFNATATDQVVKIPSNLMTYLSAIETKVRVWDMVVADRGDITGGAGLQTYVSGSPTAANEWTYSDGSRYVPGGGNVTNPTPSFIVFGTTTGTTPTTAYFSRQRQLPFESGNNVTALDIDVYVDDVQVTRYTSAIGSRPTYLSYGFSVAPDGAFVTNNTDKCGAIQFWANRLGVPQTSVVSIVNNKKTHVGVSAVQALYSNSNPDGTYVPQYGLGLFADYFNGAYPATLSIYQDRLVLGGFSHRPTLVLFSNTADSITPGTFYNFYQVTDDPLALQATSPFDIELPKRGSDDRVVALVEWQRSLFVLTRRASYRVSPNGTATLTLNSTSVTFLSATGCVNENCVVQTEGSIHYLSDNGLYDLLPRVEDGEYIAAERSIKIRKKFGVTADPLYESLAWVSYDPNEKYVYVGYPAKGNTETSVYLFVYDTSRTSWTEFDTQGYFRIFDAKPVTDRLMGNIFVAACTTEQKESNPNRGVALNFMFLKFSSVERYIDYYEFKSKQNVQGVGEDYYALQLPDIQFTIQSDWEQTFNTTYEALGQFRGYRYTPLNDVDDFIATLTTPAGVVNLTFGDDYVKTGESTVYFVRRAAAGDTYSLVWKPRSYYENGQGFTHVACWVNRDPYYGFTIGGTGDPNGKLIQFPADLPQQAFLEWGYVYCAFYESPMFFIEQLGSYKRMKHLYAFFDNESGLDTYRNFDRNPFTGQDPEQIANRYKQDINANISVMYNTERGGFVSADTYGFRDIYWDDTPIDFDPSAEQAFRYSVFKESIQGVGYSYQLAVWSTDDATFKLCGYQFSVSQKGKRFTSRF